MKKRNRFAAALLSALLLCTAVSPAASASQPPAAKTHSGTLEFKANEAKEDTEHPNGDSCWQWDKDTLALTLKGLKLDATAADAAILLQIGDKSATVTLEGENQISGKVGDAKALLATNQGAGVLTIQGTGSLKAAGGATPLPDNAVLAGGTLILTDRWAGRLTVDGGALQTAENASLTDAASELTVNSGTVALAASAYAVSASLKVNGGSVVLSGGTAAVKGTITLGEGLGLLTGTDEAGAVPALQYNGEKYLSVVPNHDISGAVKDESGNPVAGASVQVKAGEADFGEAATTDADGGYSITGLPAYGSYELALSAAAFDENTVAADLSGGDAAVDISLAKSFVEVKEIKDVPVRGIVGEKLALSGTVEPADATNKTIVWSIENAGDTQATVEDGVLSAAVSGVVTVKATIENGKANGTTYTQTIDILMDKTNEQHLADGKALIDAAVKAFAAKNETTAEELLAAATAEAPREVTVAWSAENGFQKVDATEAAAGSVKGTLNISYLTATDTLAVDLSIDQLPKSDATKLAEAGAAADTAVKELAVTNATTADDILNEARRAVGAARAADVVSVDWKSGAGFQKTDATEGAAGAITGTLALVLNSEASELAVNLTIAQLPESDATKVTKAKEAADTVVKALTATNETTADSILTAAKQAVTNGVNVAFKADSFQKTDATEGAAGSITGTLVFSLGNESQELGVSLAIAKLPVPTKTKVPVPSLKQGQYVYTGSAIKAQFNTYDTNLITSNETAGTTVGTYKTRLNLKDTGKYEWDHPTNKDGGWEYTWEIIASATPTPAPTATPAPGASPTPSPTAKPTATPAAVPKTGDTRDFTVLYWVIGISAAGVLGIVGVKLVQKRKK